MQQIRLKEFLRVHRGNCLAISILILLALLYAANNWTPSSYGWALKHYFQASPSGLVAGTPRRERSDEWAIATALTQATVNNGYERINQTSIYKEDLRSVFSMPIRDWGLFFKPSMWGYLFLPPHKAFSVYHVSFIFLFLVGYALLFQRFGIPIIASYLLSGTVFFTGYMQFWWTTFGQLASFFPWLLLLLIDGTKYTTLRSIAFWWLASATMLSAHFYPPLFIQFAFVGIIFLIALRVKLFEIRYLCSFGLAALAVLLTMYFYLRDPLLAMQTTIYPGQRISSGGGEPFRMTLSQFFPLLNIQDFRPSIRPNIPESGVIGSLFFLPLLVFLNYKQSLSKERVPIGTIAVFAVGLLAVYLWMFVNLPPWAGRVFLWTRVDPHRMYFASGMLTLGFSLVLFSKGVFRVNVTRGLILLILYSGILFIYKVEDDGIAVNEALIELMFPATLLIPCLISERFRSLGLKVTLVVVSACYGFWAFGGYNPIQSSTTIFIRQPTGVTRVLDTLVETVDGQSILNIPDFPGATLNGWGYPATSHTLLTPPLAFWDKLFPEMSAYERNQLFNRYANLQVSSTIAEPTLAKADNVWVPVGAFSSVMANPRTLRWSDSPLPFTKVLGSIDSISCEGDELTLSGWAAWRGKDPGQSLVIVSDRLPVKSEFRIRFRYDVANALGDPELARSGFIVHAKLATPCGRQQIPLCAISRHISGLTYRLDKSNATLCPN